MILRWLGGRVQRCTCALVLALAVSCTIGNDTSRRDAARPDGGHDAAGGGLDAGGRSCTRDDECNDGISCTVDTCGIGNVCRNMPLDELCGGGARCVPGSGCRKGMPSTCETNADCADGVYCNGVEQCLGPAGSRTCVPGRAVDCDDGNACTVDLCDESIDGCIYDIAPGCDAGTVPFDAGVPCDPFEPADYAGTYTFRPAAVSACTSSGTYNISEITMSVSGGTLSVRADRFTLTQSPAPTDGTFDVSYTDPCATFRLTGTFTCANQWMGEWTATFGGPTCSYCTNQRMVVRGSRR